MLLHFSSTQCSYCYSSTTTAIIPKSFHLVMILYHSTPSLFYRSPLLYSSPAVCLCLSSKYKFNHQELIMAKVMSPSKGKVHIPPSPLSTVTSNSSFAFQGNQCSWYLLGWCSVGPAGRFSSWHHPSTEKQMEAGLNSQVQKRGRAKRTTSHQ